MDQIRNNWHLYLMALLYIAAGINHFIHPEFYLAIMPPWIGWHELLVQISGACEIILGILLIPTTTRRIAAWGIILLLIAVFPANIQMTLNYFHEHRSYRWLTILRLPLQILLVIWAWRYTKRNSG